MIEEDVLSGLRTTTRFHQKLPLTSQPERVVTNPISRTGKDGPISKQLYIWRCDRSNRANAVACVPALGTPTRYCLFLNVDKGCIYDVTKAAKCFLVSARQWNEVPRIGSLRTPMA